MVVEKRSCGLTDHTLIDGLWEIIKQSSVVNCPPAEAPFLARVAGLQHPTPSVHIG